ncbi:hypothetical protein HNR77_000113 [Paenibacillus sp. JGP012]|uniref:hypothetical protein n=1 Tax=Paenibacillus sp. JGP012 TaxID=2735914 RepID=UPI0016081A1A|nr:hypothetical protein [Paenibacillus sp. JGP012]MBB6019056.1 hypothetical protein [Paenibacillus sp. JGP012]
MFDTIYIYHQLTRVEYNDLFNQLNKLSYELSGKKLYRDRDDRNAHVTNCLSSIGIQSIRLRHYKPVGYRAVEVLLRPRLLVEPGNYIDPFHIKDLETLRKNFNVINKPFGLPDLLLWKTKRIDAAIDILLSGEDIFNYMFLLKKCNIPEIMKDNILTIKYLESPHNVYLSSKNITVNFYCRYTALVNKVKEGLLKEEVDISKAKNKLRLEVQYKKCTGKLYKFLNAEYSRHLITKYYNEVIGTGDYYKLDEALSIVDSKISGPLSRTRTRMFIKGIAKYGTVHNAKQVFIQSNKKSGNLAVKDFNKYIHLLNGIGVNPVTIAESMKLNSLKNLNSRISEYYNHLYIDSSHF